ncbi:Putative toxin-antitoxin system, toxin component, type II BrnT [Desulfonema limicola]|uniref:Toxin-antitoxin system, toxin component, type II BrnT n=1 Tax=Desulfonema limicola TaxID=45656 RepID=A0A975BEA7_9BACT|nr:Putative toxin-antitoxin system, toxin component, type II BrnT [Desulfonema limicola]
MSFTWDNQKNSANIEKHGVSFKEAQTVFYDEHAVEYDDPDHSDYENRFILMGLSQKFRVLVICYCYQNNESIIRIISARKATKKEQKLYFKVSK